MRPLRCLIGRHEWKRSRFVALGTPLGEYDVQCARCHKIEGRRLNQWRRQPWRM